MSLAIPAEVNPTLLVWAREQSGYPAEIVAKRLGVKLNRLEAWERGERKPTVRQTQELAKYLPSSVRRLLPSATSIDSAPGGRGTAGCLACVLASNHPNSGWHSASCCSAESWPSISTRSLDSRFRSSGPPRTCPMARRSLGSVFVKCWASPSSSKWAGATSGKRGASGVRLSNKPESLSFSSPRCLSNRRAVSLVLDFPLPAVGINSKESSPGARIYSLLHELVHIALTLGKEETVALREPRSDTQWMEVERFAEEAASEAIIPQSALEQQLKGVTVARDGWDIGRVRALAAKFRVTPLAMATRLRSAGVMSWDGYRQWRADWSDFVSSLKPRRGGIASPVDKTLGRAGRPFVQLVLEALDANRITAVEASRYLDLRFDHIEKLRGELTSGAAGASAVDDGD